MPQVEKKVLQKDAYDALELSALVHGGIGAECFKTYVVDSGDTPLPLCIMGHAEFLDDSYVGMVYSAGPVEKALCEAFGTTPSNLGVIFDANDKVVRKVVNGDENVPVLDHGKRIPWSQWCKRTGIVRGE